jgi:hypothetical protein
MMNCRTAQLLLSFFRPRAFELDASEAEALNNHLVECAPCAALARHEQDAEKQLGTAMRNVSLPANLRQRLLTRLQAERKTWYRRLPRRHPRIATAAAAVLLLAVGLAVYAAVRPPRALDLQEIAANWNDSVPRSAEQVQRYFAEQGFKTVAPPDFNYQYLTSCDLEIFAGVLVPRLHFVRGQNHASVYILSAAHFDVRAAVDQPREGSGRFTVELRPGPPNSNVAYLIKYTGGSLDWFLEEEKKSST